MRPSCRPAWGPVLVGDEADLELDLFVGADDAHDHARADRTMMPLSSVIGGARGDHWATMIAQAPAGILAGWAAILGLC